MQLLYSSNIYTLIACTVLHYNKCLGLAKLLGYFKKSDKIITVTFLALDHSGYPLPLDQYNEKMFLPEITTLYIPRKMIS
jgi:hypothetical protein